MILSIFLLLREGLVIITGCAHAGIVNTIIHAKQVTGVNYIYAVIGGLHLVDADDRKLTETLKVLDEVEWLFVGHCTGSKAISHLKELKGEKMQQIRSGAVISLPMSNSTKPISYIPPAQRSNFRKWILVNKN